MDSRRTSCPLLENEYVLNIGKLPTEGLPSTEQSGKVTDRPDITSAKYSRGKATIPTNSNKQEDQCSCNLKRSPVI